MNNFDKLKQFVEENAEYVVNEKYSQTLDDLYRQVFNSGEFYFDDFNEELVKLDHAELQIEAIDQIGQHIHEGEIEEIILIGDQYFRREGVYNSWDSHHWEPWKQAKPVEVTITEFQYI